MGKSTDGQVLKQEADMYLFVPAFSLLEHYSHRFFSDAKKLHTIIFFNFSAEIYCVCTFSLKQGSHSYTSFFLWNIIDTIISMKYILKAK